MGREEGGGSGLGNNVNFPEDFLLLVADSWIKNQKEDLVSSPSPPLLPRDLELHCVCMLVTQLCPTLCNSMAPHQAPLSMVLQARILEWVVITFSGGFSDPGIESGSPELQADSLTI